MSHQAPEAHRDDRQQRGPAAHRATGSRAGTNFFSSISRGFPGQARRITDARHAQQVSGLGLTTEDLHRQDDRQLREAPPPAQTDPTIDRMHPQREPGRADQVNDVGILKQDRAAEERIREHSSKRRPTSGWCPHARINTSMLLANASAEWARI